MGRVEVRSDATDEYIQGAKVSVMHKDKVIMSKQTDMGGNAAFSRMELVDLIPANAAKSDVYFRVEADGYESGTGPFIGGQITEIRLLKAPAPAEPEYPLGLPLWAWLGGAGAVAGLLVLALTKK